MAKSLLDKFEEYKKLKQQEQEQAKAPKYIAPDTESIVTRYESYKQQRQAEQQAAVSAKRVNNPYHLRNVMVTSAVQNTQRKQAAAVRVAKEEEEEEARRVKQEEMQSWSDYVQRLRDQYMPVRPDPIPQVDINKKYGPQSELPKRGVAIASTGMSDAPLQMQRSFTSSGSGRSYGGRSGSLGESIDDLTAQRDKLLEEIETLDTVLLQPVGRHDFEGQRNLTNAQEQRSLAEKALTDIENRMKEQNKADQQTEDAAQYTDNETVVADESEKQSIDDLTAQRAEIQKDLKTYDEVLKWKGETQTGPDGYGGRSGSLGPTPQVETAGQTIEELTAERDKLLEEIETLDTVLKWPVGRLDVEGQRNKIFAQLQRPQAQKALDELDKQIKRTEKEAQQAEDDAQVEALKAKYEAAPEGEKGQVLAELKDAEYNRDWNAMTPLEKTGAWLGDRAQKVVFSWGDSIYAIPDLIADVAGIERLQWSKNNKAAMAAVQQNIERQAKKTGWLVNAAGEVVTAGLRMVPTFLTAVLTGGASLPAQGAANIATAGAGTGAKVAQATTAMLKDPKFVHSFFDMFGLNLSQAREAGVDPATAVSMSWQKALPSALIEMSGGYEKAAERGRGWMDWLIGSLEEGGEEVAQGITDTAVEKTFGNVFNMSVDDVISLTNQEAIVSGVRAAEEFGLGTVTAGVMGGAQIGLLKGMDAITGNDPRRIETFPSDESVELNKKIAENEAKIAALEAAARSDNELRDSEAGKQYNELVQVVNSALPAESATRAMIAEEGPIDATRMEAVAKGALSEYSELLKANPSDEVAGKAQALNKAIDALYTGIKTDRDTTVDKYTAGLDETVKSEIKGKTGDEAVAYAKGYGIAHALGQIGVPNDTIAKATGFKDAKKAAEEGRAKWDNDLPKAKAKAAELRKTLPVPGKGSVSYHSNVKQDALTTGQRDQIALLEQVAKPMGYRFVMVEFEKDAAGNYVTDKGQIAPNGYFRDTDGTIYIDVNAGKTAGRMVEDTIIPQTAGHELTHYLKANAPDLFRAYGAAVIDELSAKGQDINALIAQKIGRAKQSSIGVEVALEEVIADSSAMMLQNTQAIQKMAETNPGLFEKITEWVKDFIEKIRKAFSKVEGTPEAKALMSMRDGVMKYADSLQKMWDDMAVSVAQAKLDEKPAVVARRDVQVTEEQAQNTENVPKQAASERDADVKFQMREPVEETAKLIAVHNLNEAQLLSSVELGGFAMPSIAVIKAGQPHDRYGDISIVFGKETIDPKNRKNKVYGGDAWTPSFPQINHEISGDSTAAIRKKVSGLLGELYKPFDIQLSDDSIKRAADNNRGSFADAYENEPGLMGAYLKSIGEDFIPYSSEPEYAPWSGIGNEAVKYLADKMGGELQAAYNKPFDEKMAMEPAIRGVINEYFEQQYSDTLSKKQLREMGAEEYGFNKIDEIIRGVGEYLKTKGAGRLDKYETGKMLRRRFAQDNHLPAYRAWLDELFADAISKRGIRNNADIFTPSGNRRSFSATHWAVTLENVVRVMRSQDGKGSDSFGSSGLFGVSTKNYSSLDDIRKDIDRLQQMDEEQYKAKKDEFQNRIVELANEIAPEGERNRFIALNNAAEVLTEAARKGTTAGIQRVLNGYKDYYNIREDTAKKLYQLMSDISRMPTEYFEAKPERAVGFDEVRAVIIPDTASDELKKALDNMSATVIEYKADDEADRLKALNSPELDGVKFQERDSEDTPLTAEQIEYFKDSKARDAQGRLLKVYHGSPNKFTTFSREYIGANTGRLDNGAGFYFSSEKTGMLDGAASWYGDNITEAYLDIKNPLLLTDASSIDLLKTAAQLRPDKKLDGYTLTEILDVYSDVLNREFDVSDGARNNSKDIQVEYDGRTYTLRNYTGNIENNREDVARYFVSSILDVSIPVRLGDYRINNEIIKNYDGVINGNEYVVFSPEQIKSTTNLTPTSSPDIRYQERDASYLAAVESGDMDTAQRMVNEYAAARGYDADNDFRMTHEAPTNDGYNKPIHDMTAIYPSDFYEKGVEYYGSYTEHGLDYEALSKLRKVRGKPDARLWIYRAVPADVKGDHFRNGDWVTITRGYAQLHGRDNIDGAYRVIAKRVPAKHIYTDANSIQEYGYDDGQSYAYANTKNNAKLLDAVTYDNYGSVIALSKRFNKRSDDIRYQERDPDYRTKRDILAGAFDSVAQTEGEKRNLKEYKNLIGSLNRMEEEARGLRQANTEERKKPDRDKAVIESNTKRIAEIEERINNLDKRLLKMQNAAPLQNVLKREVDYYKRQQSALNKQQLEKYRADRAETAMKQRYRGDITKGVKTLNTMLVNESDQKHIPEGFKGAVLDFLRLFTDDTSVFDYKRLSVLKDMYDALETSDSELAGMYDFDIAGDIADAARMLEGKRLSQLTESELESLRDIVAHFNHIVKNENLIFTQKRSVKTTDAAEEGLSEYGKKAKEMRLAILSGKNPIAAINKFLTSKNVKPVYFFKRVGGILQELFDDVRAAQGKWAFQMAKDRAFFRNSVQKYNYYKWIDDGQLAFTTTRGDQITLTRDQALELYAINKREKTNKQQGAEHLAIGGFVYNDAVKVKKKSALGVPMTYEVNVGENHPLTDSDLEKIGKWLTNEQRAFADEMVNYLSAVMGERGNEVSMALYGLRKYKEKYYFPYKSASNYLYSRQGGVQDDSAIKHRSFTRRTTVSANNPVVLTGFTKVWADHVQNMNLYSAMAVPLDNFNRVYNYRIRGDKDNTKTQSVKAALEAAYGKEANAYIKQLLNDVNGGIRPDKGDAEARKMMSLWKKGAVFASLSVVVQQPSAIGRALALVDPKYFRKGYTKAGYEEMMKWSGVANIKAMGRFDANMGMTAAGWLTQREYTGMDEKAKAFAKDGSFRDDVLSWLPQKADEMTWTALWEAVKRETASKHGNLIGSDAFMQKVAERFDEVVDYTQVYDSVLSRSEVMRSQSALAQMVTAFMAEPTTAYNMLLDSVVNAKNKGMKNYVKPGRALGAFVVSVMLNSILKAMVTAGRDDDEKYTLLEKYLRKVSGGIADELNPLGLVPYGRDILSLWEGYDIERADMSLIGDLLNAVKKMGKADMPLMKKADTLAGAIGNALGIPYKNVRRDIQGVYNALASSAPLAMQSASGAKYSLLEGLPWFDASRAGYARKLYSAITNGDKRGEAELREQISKIVKKDSDINTELRKIITTEFEEERLEPRIALQQMIDLTGLKEAKGKIGDWYKTGLITEDVAEQLLVEFTADDQPNERYKTIEGWNFSKNPDNEGESYSTYKAFYEAIDSGKDLRTVIDTYMDPEKYGASKSTLSGRITDNYKEQYIETYKRSKSEAAALKARLLNAYVMLGYDREKKSKDIDAWLK